jgi:hypothetical protein
VKDAVVYLIPISYLMLIAPFLQFNHAKYLQGARIHTLKFLHLGGKVGVLGNSQVKDWVS